MFYFISLLGTTADFFFHVSRAQSGPGTPHLQGFTITQNIPLDSPGWVIGPTQRPLPHNTQHSQKTAIQAACGIRTHIPSRRAAADLRL